MNADVDYPVEVLPEPPSRTIAFLPWLVLKSEVEIGGYRFVPFRASNGAVHSLLAEIETSLTRILSSYVERDGKPIDNCTVVLSVADGWNLAGRDLHFADASWAASLVFLATVANNDLFHAYSRRYVNSSMFRLVGQRFQGEAVWISLAARRRHGRLLDGGYKHGEVKFVRPPHCSGTDDADTDELFAAALGKADSASSATTVRLHVALSFLELANTDDDLMTDEAEAILMATAFELLLDADGSKYDLGVAFRALFGPHGQTTVSAALPLRPGIEIDSKYEEAQRTWWVHGKWIEELYRLRSKSAHKGQTKTQTWAWTPFEHLAMAAFVFPLTVKLMLVNEGHYALTDYDIAACRAIDRLLVSRPWKEQAEPYAMPTVWQSILDDERHKIVLDVAISTFGLKFDDAAGGAKESE